ncbi:MAG TPA: hypothetical protein VGF94_23940 [Kofleriaceae bacterium]|jgi:hypothetical protein
MKYLLLAFAIALAACAADRATPPPPAASSPTHLTEPGDAIDQRLMVALSQAKNLHHKAKVFMSEGDMPSAIASVREILTLEFPAGAPEAEDVRDDARALLGKLLVGQGQLDEAMRVVQEGIAGSQRESFFVANLYTVTGEIHEARAQQLDGGDAAAKARAIDEKHAAIEAFDRSNQIDIALQKQLSEHP